MPLSLQLSVCPARGTGAEAKPTGRKSPSRGPRSSGVLCSWGPPEHLGDCKSPAYLGGAANSSHLLGVYETDVSQGSRALCSGSTKVASRSGACAGVPRKPRSHVEGVLAASNSLPRLYSSSLASVRDGDQQDPRAHRPGPHSGRPPWGVRDSCGFLDQVLAHNS